MSIPADTIYTGDIVTVNNAQPTRRSRRRQDGRIAAVGPQVCNWVCLDRCR